MASASEIFRTPANPYATIEIRRNGWKAGAPAILVLMVLIMLAFSDIRFLIVALILMFVLYPMLLLMAWLKLTASPGMTLRLRPQRWTRNDNGTLTIEFLHWNNPDSDMGRPRPMSDMDMGRPRPMSDMDMGRPRPMSSIDATPVETRTLTADDIDSIEHVGNYYVINLEKGDFPGFYILPSQIINDNPTLLNNL